MDSESSVATAEPAAEPVGSVEAAAPAIEPAKPVEAAPGEAGPAQAAKTVRSVKAKESAQAAARSKGRRYRPWERERILGKFGKLRDRGLTAVEAAVKLGVPYVTLLAWSKKAGKPLPGTPLPRGRKPGRPTKDAIKHATGHAGSAARKPGRKPGRPKGRPRLARELRSAGRSGGLTLVTPQGARIEGIGMRDLLRALRAAT